MTTGVVRLSLPADAGYAGVARLTAAGLAARSGCTYDGSIEMVFDVDDEALAVRMTGDFGAGALPTDGEVAALSDQILAAVVDDYEYEPSAHTVRFRKIRAG